MNLFLFFVILCSLSALVSSARCAGNCCCGTQAACMNTIYNRDLLASDIIVSDNEIISDTIKLSHREEKDCQGGACLEVLPTQIPTSFRESIRDLLSICPKSTGKVLHWSFSAIDCQTSASYYESVVKRFDKDLVEILYFYSKRTASYPHTCLRTSSAGHCAQRVLGACVHHFTQVTGVQRGYKQNELLIISDSVSKPPAERYLQFEAKKKLFIEDASEVVMIGLGNEEKTAIHPN
ncbi:hypothetical protein M0812_16642 [Anaeramoeba flamelloides]|uniref:Uncharacterized protein n=1 Tax=Anaeramoeba flamelloides TaxID=1746091 RepID=A0AAV7Z8T7_9EUKA|nr:hypothetical protein M0812_16642 [Anaeramoeba flamelloides]|eukprot:Anaeramoba_flamelloidesa808387_17.p1 GENE.a808387_17~~a808387_17.p1  ORF type:complete len:236 (+),score=6.75 a808387_17:1-708(+)